MRRFLCPLCRCVIKCRPQNFFSRFQTAIEAIKLQLASRIATGRWPKAANRGRGRHWMAALKRKALVYLGLDWLKHLAEAFDRLLELGIVPVSVSF